MWLQALFITTLSITTLNGIELGNDCGALELIRFHQEVITDIDGPRSHYYPSSSEYTRQAIERYGLLEGIALGCDRLLRENRDEGLYPLFTLRSGITLKFDPAPEEQVGPSPE